MATYNVLAKEIPELLDLADRLEAASERIRGAAARPLPPDDCEPDPPKPKQRVGRFVLRQGFTFAVGVQWCNSYGIGYRLYGLNIPFSPDSGKGNVEDDCPGCVTWEDNEDDDDDDDD